MELIQIVALVASLVSLAFAAFLAYKVVGKDEGNDQIRFIGKAIQDGAMAFLSREYSQVKGNGHFEKWSVKSLQSWLIGKTS